MISQPQRGTLFWHKHFLNPAGGKGKALCRVTTVRNGMVYHTYATNPSNRGAFKLPLETWLEAYGNQIVLHCRGCGEYVTNDVNADDPFFHWNDQGGGHTTRAEAEHELKHEK